MKKFKLPTDLGSDYKKPSILKVKNIQNINFLNKERNHSDCCCLGYTCHDCPSDCFVNCSCVSDICICQGAHLPCGGN